MDIEQIKLDQQRMKKMEPSQRVLGIILLVLMGVGFGYWAYIGWNWLFPPVDPAVRAAEIDAINREALVIQTLKYYAKDPDSVQLRNVNTTQIATCGEYNAKNSFGAYPGYKRFVSDGKKELLTEDDVGKERMDMLWQLYCQTKS